MKILGLVEGPQINRGNIFLPGVYEIHKSLSDRGHETSLYIAGGNLNYNLLVQDQDGVRSIDSNYHIKWLSSYGSWRFSPALLWDLIKLDKHYDFIILHSLYSFPVAIGHVFSRIIKVPYGIYLHGVLSHFQRQISWKKKTIYNYIIGKSILNKASVIFYTGIIERNWGNELNIGVPSVIIPHGIDASIFNHLPYKGEFRAKYFNGHKGSIVLYVGRINLTKGLDLLVDSMALVVKEVPDVRLAIVGAGDPPEYLNQIKEMVRKHNLEKYTQFTGFLIGHEKLSAFADADMCIVPSHTENFCFAMFEAMSCKVPVVISNSLALATEVARYDAGIVVDRCPKDFAMAIIKILKDKKLGRLMGEKGFQLAQNYSWGKTAKNIEKTIQCVLENVELPSTLTQL